MSSRFGASSPSRSRNAKLKILIACMLLLLLVLFGTLVYVVQNSDNASGSNIPALDPKANEVPQVPSLTQGILIPVFRIEEGTKLSPEMFRAEMVPKDQVPQGAYNSDHQAALGEKFSKRIINANVPLTFDDVSDAPPINAITIPPGFRLTTIIVDSRSGVEGWAKPGTRVDVLWNFVQDGSKKVATIARFVKVVSVAGNSQNSPDAPKAQVAGPVTVSLLVSEEQAKFIELARTSGDLSLVLVGGNEQPVNLGERPEVINIDTILGKVTDLQEGPKVEIEPDGVLYVDDPATGKQKRYILKNGKWAIDKAYTE